MFAHAYLPHTMITFNIAIDEILYFRVFLDIFVKIL